MMNRQLRRAQEKADKKAAKEKEKAKAERQAKRYLRQQRRAERKRPKATATAPRRGFMLPLWLTVVFTFFSAFTIIVQALVPSEDGALNVFIRIAYYFLFPYFLYAWLARVKVAQALYISIGVGLLLTFLSGTLPFFLADVAPDVRLVIIGVPATVLGGYLGQLVMRRSG